MLSSTRFTNGRKVPFIWLGYRHSFLALSFSRLRRSKKSTCGQVYTNGYWRQTAWVNLRWTSISSRGSRNTPWCFIPQKQRWLSFSRVGFLLAHIRLCTFYLYWRRNRLTKWSSELREGPVIFQNLLPQLYFRPEEFVKRLGSKLGPPPWPALKTTTLQPELNQTHWGNINNLPWKSPIDYSALLSVL